MGQKARGPESWGWSRTSEWTGTGPEDGQVPGAGRPGAQLWLAGSREGAEQREARSARLDSPPSLCRTVHIAPFIAMCPPSSEPPTALNG